MPVNRYLILNLIFSIKVIFADLISSVTDTKKTPTLVGVFRKFNFLEKSLISVPKG